MCNLPYYLNWKVDCLGWVRLALILINDSKVVALEI